MYRTNVLAFIFIMLIVVACDNNRDLEHNEDAVSTPESEMMAGLVFSDEQIKQAGIEFGSIQTHRLSNDVQARGELVLPINSVADIVSPYPGTIRKVFVKLGEKVTRSQHLASVYSNAFIEAQQQYLMVKNQIVMLEQEYERQKELNKDKISSDKFYQRSQAEYNVARAELTGLELQLRNVGVNVDALRAENINTEHLIKSPIDGFIENVNVNPGMFVDQEESIFQVINRDHLLIELNVFEKDIVEVRLGQRVTFTLSNMNSEIHEAIITSIGNSVQGESRIVKVLAEFENISINLLPGMFVASEIHTGESEVAALPEEAVLRHSNNKYIIFYTSPNMKEGNKTYFDFVPVNVGNIEDNMAEVNLLEPLPEDAMIVVKGGYYLRTEKAKQDEP